MRLERVCFVRHRLEMLGAGGLVLRRCAHGLQVSLGAAVIKAPRAFDLAKLACRSRVLHASTVLIPDLLDSTRFSRSISL